MLRNIASFKQRLPLIGGRQFSAAPLAKDYDYVIVGGGTAGLVLANRLTADPATKVLVIEKGLHGSETASAESITIPVALAKLFFSDIDTQYYSAPDAGANGRPIYLPRANVVGGCSNFNALLYHRGMAGDYKEWGEGWQANDVLPFYKKSETNSRGPSKFHGGEGHINVSDPKYCSPLIMAMLEGAKEYGLKSVEDFNNWDIGQAGFGRSQMFVRPDGYRSSANAYYDAVKDRKNLTLVTGSTTKRVMFEGKKAVGVEFMNDMGQMIEVPAAKEVLLCGGAINSPQLLMLSGIGPKDHLNEMGVPVLVENENVGQNLQDQPAALMCVHAPEGLKDFTLTEEITNKGFYGKAKMMGKFKISGTGPLTSSGCEQGCFINTKGGDKMPDLQMRFAPGGSKYKDGLDYYKQFAKQNLSPIPGFVFQNILCRPQTRSGVVKLNSDDFKQDPYINVNFLQEQADVDTLVSGIKISREIAAQNALKPYFGYEINPGKDMTEDKDLEEYVRSSVHTSNGLAGSVALGSCLNQDLTVKGTQGLRVIDASVQTKIVGGQLAASVFMIAEKGADMILNGQ